ncbi:hypothetical protein HanRHA438_Chr14g0649251 [Helianthus annuus]|nr:hypothetical protein HanIR_Chr14g0693191 [Helianthus annuus]KAJ0853275.1 hypothetical protein HanRHA438_Chr14g0649251 [Helianthus annuus]
MCVTNVSQMCYKDDERRTAVVYEVFADDMELQVMSDSGNDDRMKTEGDDGEGMSVSADDNR